jgi:hypothetical protein
MEPCMTSSFHCSIKANSHIPYRSSAAPMLFPCHAVPLMVYIVSFPFDLHSAAMFDSHMHCRARAMPILCRFESEFSRSRHSAAWVRHGMCELASAVQIRHVGLPMSGFFRLPRGVPRSYQKHTNPLTFRISSSIICGYDTGFHKGHGSVGESQESGMECVN